MNTGLLIRPKLKLILTTVKKQSIKKLSWSVDALSILKRRIEDEQASIAKAAISSKPGKSSENNSKKHSGKHFEKYSGNKDDGLFLKAMSDVKEMPEFRALSYRTSKVEKQPKKYLLDHDMRHSVQSNDIDEELLSVMTGSSRIDISQTDEYIQGYSLDVRPDLCEAMHTGRIPAQDSFDMHGLILDEAKPALEEFIRQARNRGLRCVNIIHGRGLRSPAGPVLKEAIRNWMDSGPLRKFVMAYATAPPSDGGPGATYLLLR